MNYVYDPAVAAQIAAYVDYVTPVAGAQGRAVRRPDPETANNPLIFPTEDMLSQVQPVRLDRAEQRGLHRGLADGARSVRR